jgi:hypothetical protein
MHRFRGAEVQSCMGSETSVLAPNNAEAPSGSCSPLAVGYPCWLFAVRVATTRHSLTAIPCSPFAVSCLLHAARCSNRIRCDAGADPLDEVGDLEGLREHVERRAFHPVANDLR